MVRLFVMDAGWKDGTPTPMVFVNPTIIALAGEEVVGREACLSIPGIAADVARPGRVHLTLDG